MKFVIVQEISYHQKDRVVILKREEDYFRNSIERTVTYLCSAVINVTKDWDIDAPISIVDDTHSIQYRPKGIFKSSKGYFYKNKGTVYLTEIEVQEMFDFIENAKIYLNCDQKIQ